MVLGSELDRKGRAARGALGARQAGELELAAGLQAPLGLQGHLRERGKRRGPERAESRRLPSRVDPEAHLAVRGAARQAQRERRGPARRRDPQREPDRPCRRPLPREVERDHLVALTELAALDPERERRRPLDQPHDEPAEALEALGRRRLKRCRVLGEGHRRRDRDDLERAAAREEDRQEPALEAELAGADVARPPRPRRQVEVIEDEAGRSLDPGALDRHGHTGRPAERGRDEPSRARRLAEEVPARRQEPDAGQQRDRPEYHQDRVPAESRHASSRARRAGIHRP